jgi:hypothetical protein
VAPTDPPSPQLLELLHYVEDLDNYIHSKPKTTSDAARLLWFHIRRLRGLWVEWPLPQLGGIPGVVPPLAEVAGVTSIQADAGAPLTGAVILASGSNITLTEVGQTITVAMTSGVALLADVTLAGDAATIDTGAGGVAAGYKQLIVETSLRTDEVATGNAAFLRFNADSGANYDRYGFSVNNGVTTIVSTFAGAGFLGVRVATASSDANMFGDGTVTIPEYASTTKLKSMSAFSSCIGIGNAGNAFRTDVAGRWRSTAAISRVSLHLNGGTVFKAGSRLTVYGVT